MTADLTGIPSGRPGSLPGGIPAHSGIPGGIPVPSGIPGGIPSGIPSGVMAELHSRSLVPAEPLAVMVVGSVARGWANARSDYDIYVIVTVPWRRPGASRKPVPLRPATVAAETLQVDGRRWELKYWLDSQVDQMFAKVTWEQFESGRAPVDPLVPAEETFLERLVSCVPLEGAEWVARRRAELGQTAFRAFLVTRSLALADGYIEDALGQMGGGDTDSAVLSARIAFGHTVDALLESRGHYGSAVPKWRARRVRDAQLPVLHVDRYWALETMADFDQQHPHTWIEQVVSLCKELSLEVEI